jgi:hypothetical protein
MSGNQDLIRASYAAFNARDLDAALAGLHADVDWPNAIDGGRLRGREEVREYWSRQFETIDPRVEPRSFSEDEHTRIVVDVHQVVRDLDGEVIADQNVQHVYTISAELIARMDIRSSPQPAELDALERLDVLIGRWKTEGWTTDASGIQVDRIEALDTYERLPGGALLHLVDARVGDVTVEGAEIIGYDPARGSYVTQYFGTDGPASYEASLREDEETLVWTMLSAADRFTGTFNDDLTVITGHWDALGDDSNWGPWMDITLTKEAS